MEKIQRFSLTQLLQSEVQLSDMFGDDKEALPADQKLSRWPETHHMVFCLGFFHVLANYWEHALDLCLHSLYIFDY